jgi:hypothetical protein
MGQSNLIQQALQELTSRNYWQRMKAAQLISRLGDETHIEQVFNTFEFPPVNVFNLKQFKSLEPPLSYPHPVYQHPIEPIVARCRIEIIPLLLRWLRETSTSRDGKDLFITNTLVHISEHAIPELCQMAFYDENESIRSNARIILLHTDFNFIAPHLKILRRQEKDWRKRVLIVLFAHEASLEFLVDTLDDEEIVIQRTAITQLKKIGTPEALAAVAAWEQRAK